MSKRPQWFDQTPVLWTSHQALMAAAKVIRQDAKYRRKNGQLYYAQMAEWYAAAIERVVGGQTWNEAFFFPEEEAK